MQKQCQEKEAWHWFVWFSSFLIFKFSDFQVVWFSICLTFKFSNFQFVLFSIFMIFKSSDFQVFRFPSFQISKFSDFQVVWFSIFSDFQVFWFSSFLIFKFSDCQFVSFSRGPIFKVSMFQLSIFKMFKLSLSWYSENYKIGSKVITGIFIVMIFGCAIIVIVIGFRIPAGKIVYRVGGSDASHHISSEKRFTSCAFINNLS